MMDVIRYQKTVVNTVNEYQIGDKIKTGKYTATCQKVTPNGAIFMLDQLLDKPYQMHSEFTNNVVLYQTSDLRRNLSADFEADKEFDAISEYLVPFENGVFVRIPTVGEIFGNQVKIGKDVWYTMDDDAEQWELMKNRQNRLALREGAGYGYYWLQNVVKKYEGIFAYVMGTGNMGAFYMETSIGVRPVFMLSA